MAAATGAIVAACAPAAPEIVEVEKEVPIEKVVKETVVVEKVIEKVVEKPPKPAEKVTFEFWTQDWGPLLEICEAVRDQMMEADENLNFIVKPIPWGDLTTKLIPACAAGTEGDGFFSYTYMWRGVDTSKLLLPLSPIISHEELEAIVFPEVLSELEEVGQELYFVPLLSGFDRAFIVANADHFEAGYDFSQIDTWEALVEVAKEQAQWDASGNMTRIGLIPGGFPLAAHWCLSLGGSFYDKDKRAINLHTPEMEWAFQELWKIYNEYKFSDIEFEIGTENPFGAGLTSMVNYGPYHYSGVKSSMPELNIDGFVLPSLADIKPEDQRFWQNALFGVSLSRKLAKNPAKLAVGGEFLRTLLEPDNLLLLLEYYSGGVCSPGVYESPKLSEVKYGPITKDFGERLWRRMVMPGNLVMPPYDEINAELQRMFRNEISVSEALDNIERVWNELESVAVARKYGG